MALRIKIPVKGFTGKLGQLHFADSVCIADVSASDLSVTRIKMAYPGTTVEAVDGSPRALDGQAEVMPFRKDGSPYQFEGLKSEEEVKKAEEERQKRRKEAEEAQQKQKALSATEVHKKKLPYGINIDGPDPVDLEDESEDPVLSGLPDVDVNPRVAERKAKA